MTFLVTGIQGDLGQSAATVLRRHYPDSRIVGIDASDLGAGALVADEVLRAPRADDADYAAWLTTACDRHRIEVLVPCSDAEVVALSALISADLPPAVMPNPAVVTAGHDKLETSRRLAAAGIATPVTVALTQIDEVDFPCIIKPRSGQGSRGVHVVRTSEEASAMAGLLVDPILQQLLTPAAAEMTCAVLGLADGSVRVLVLERRLGGGSTIWARVAVNPRVEDYCRGIARALDLRGPMNVQLVDTVDGPLAFEINPRLSSTVAMRDLLGFPDLYWAVEDVLGRTVPPPEPVTPGAIAVRVPDVRVVPFEGG